VNYQKSLHELLNYQYALGSLEEIEEQFFSIAA
jgi:hypothetical protein